jgi:hypothetical protein
MPNPPPPAAKIARLQRDRWSHLQLTLDDRRVFENIKATRLFPFSDREAWISLRDGTGREIILVESLTQLNAEVRQQLESDLHEQEFLPVIERVLSVSGDVEPCEWQVQTDRGTTRFVLKHVDDVRRLDAQRALVTDAFGVRYLVADLGRLDPFSRRVMEQYV